MFSAILIAQDRDASRQIEQGAVETSEVCIYRTILGLPSPYQLARLLNGFHPDIVFLDLSGFEDAQLLAREIRVVRPETAIIGFGPLREGGERLAAEAGVSEALSLPLTCEAFQDSVKKAIHKVRARVEDNLVVFMPAKGGSGATTVAANVAGYLANGLGQKVLVIEADLRSGLMSVLFKCGAEYSVLDALENAAQLDGTLWSKTVVEAQGLSLLVTSRPKREPALGWVHYYELLQFAVPRYQAVIVDLPEVFNDAAAELTRYARSVFIVCTPEVPSLVLARQRCEELRDRSVPDDRIGIVLNRWQKQDLKVKDIEDILGQPVRTVLQNDYRGVQAAIAEGRLVSDKSELGKSVAAFAKTVANLPLPVSSPKSRLGFLESVIPTRASA